MIKALAQAGLELATIKDYLDQDAFSLSDLLVQQISTLDKQLRASPRCASGWFCCAMSWQRSEPDLESWLQTLELMKMYDRWFSQQELQAAVCGAG
jgi:DNA-binding transcriptional MerR regulator